MDSPVWYSGPSTGDWRGSARKRHDSRIHNVVLPQCTPTHIFTLHKPYLHYRLLHTTVLSHGYASPMDPQLPNHFSWLTTLFSVVVAAVVVLHCKINVLLFYLLFANSGKVVGQKFTNSRANSGFFFPPSEKNCASKQ